MAIGDAALAAGFLIVSGSGDDIRLAYQEINRTRDYLANHLSTGTHDASALTTGLIDNARIPLLLAAKIPNHSAALLTSGTVDVARLPSIPPNKISDTFNLLLPTHAIQGSQLISLSDVDAVGTVNAIAAPSTGLSGWTSAVLRNSDGKLGVAVSSARFKKNIKPAAQRRTLLAATVVTFVYKVSVDPTGELQRGLIAEQLDELGLTEYVVYDADGAPFSIRYELLAIDLLGIAQEHDERIAALEEKVGA